MQKYFNINLEFDKTIIDNTIKETLAKNEKGYICVMESNNLTVANTNSHFLNIVNNSLINICDGSNVAWLLGKIHKQPFKSYIGVDIFRHYIDLKQYRHFFLGNTKEVLEGMKKTLIAIDPQISTMQFEELPFRKVNEFDYHAIAQLINEDKPDFIWVSLGAPKQEEFMSLLLPHIKRGIMLGVGAAFNFTSGGVGQVKRAPQWMRKLRLEWFYRAFEEPKKNIPRYWGFVKILPRLVSQEMRKRK